MLRLRLYQREVAGGSSACLASCNIAACGAQAPAAPERKRRWCQRSACAPMCWMWLDGQAAV